MDASRRRWRGGAASWEGKAGSYRYTAVTGAWEWSGAVYQIHGFTPGGLVPDAELMLAHAVTGDGPAQQILATAGPRLEIHAQQPAAGRSRERP